MSIWCDGCTPVSEETSEPDKGSSKSYVYIAIAVACVVLGIALLVVVGVLVRWCISRSRGRSEDTEMGAVPPAAASPQPAVPGG